MLQAAAAEEENHVDDRHEDSRPVRPASQHQAHHKEQHVNGGQVLHLDGQEKEHHKLVVRVKGGEGQKQRQVQVAVAAVPGEKRRRNGPQSAGEVKQVEPEHAPLGFQGAAQQAVKIQVEQDPQGGGGGRDKQEGDEPPHLALKEHGPVQAEQRLQLREHQAENINQQHAAGDNEHQVGDGQPPPLPFQAINPIHRISPFCGRGARPRLHARRGRELVLLLYCPEKYFAMDPIDFPKQALYTEKAFLPLVFPGTMRHGTGRRGLFLWPGPVLFTKLFQFQP